MTEDREPNLFAWILGGALITTVAVAAVIASTHTPASRPLKVPAPGAVDVAAPAPSPPPLPRAPVQAPPTMQPAARDGLPAGSVWECVVNGERTFSDAPCGAHASVRQLSELNLMDSAGVPPAPYVGYDARYTTTVADQYAPDVGNDSYPNPEVILISERLRRAHSPGHGNHSHAPRKQ
jgi:hypothetical protein